MFDATLDLRSIGAGGQTTAEASRLAGMPLPKGAALRPSEDLHRQCLPTKNWQPANHVIAPPSD